MDLAVVQWGRISDGSQNILFIFFYEERREKSAVEELQWQISRKFHENSRNFTNTRQ